jgi:hypothetical protein
MKLTKQKSLCATLWLGTSLACMVLSGTARAQGFTTTTVQGTVYLANGHPGSGSLQVSWPTFTTANNQAVAAGRMNVTIGADGYVSVNLAANLGATPEGLYYTAVYHLSDGTTSTEYWVVPAAAQASLSQVRAQVMPAAQAVQAVSKAYVDQSVQELTQSLLTASGGSLSGPLFLNGDPLQPTQAASKHYVDTEFGMAVPMSGGALTGPLTSVQLGAAYQVDQFPGADFGAKLQACVNILNATYGGTCDARNFSGNLVLSSILIIGKANATVQLPCATISTSSRINIPGGTRNVTLHGCALRGASASSGSAGGTVFLYSGTGAMMQVGDPTYGVDTSGFHIDNAVINTTGSSSSTAEGLAAYRTQEMNLASLYFLGNSNQTGITLDGTGNYTGGTFQDIELGGFGTAVNAIGHQAASMMTTDWLNASTFLRLHIDCPTNGGTPIAGTYGINLQQGDGNTFTGGDVEGCSTALHLGPNAQNNTIVGLRNENSTNQVVADAGSSYNNWITGGTMFTGQLTDNGTRNSFLDTFHRSFNGLNGDWYGSQQDATVTNHFRLGTGNGNERGLLNRYQTDSGYRWTMGFSDATAGEQFYQVLDELNNVYRLSMGQYNNGQSSSNNQTVINAAGSGAVVLNGSSNSGTGGILFGSGGASAATVASINNAGNAQFNGTLQVGGPSTFTNSTTVKNQVDAEIDSFLWAGATANQKESYTYKDYTGTSQWYMVKDASNNWALNSATGGLDSFKAYQSSNSGDTYINASNPTGHIRLNYETGSGAETDIYSGASSGLVAAFLGSTAIKFPGLAAASGHNCLQIDNSGYISNSGSACGTSQNGTVNTGNAGQVAYYTSNGNVIAGMNAVAVNAGGTGASSAAQALQNLGAQSVLTGVASDGASGIAVAGTVAASTAVASSDSPTKNPLSKYNDWGYFGCSNSVVYNFVGAGNNSGQAGSFHHCVDAIGNFHAPGIDLGTTAFGVYGWSQHIGLNLTQTSNSPGISSALITSHTKAGIGDTSNYFYNYNYGGAIAGSDEGNHLLGLAGGEASTVYTGTVNTGGAGATTVKVNCTADCAFPGDGRPLLDMNSPIAVTVTAKTVPSGTTPGTYSIVESVTPSTAWGTIAANVQTPLPTTGTIGVAAMPMTFTVNSGPGNAGSFSPGDLVCFSGDFHEQAKLSSVSGSGPWTLTVSLRHQHGINSWVMANGPCGKFHEFTANTQHPGVQDLRYPIDILGATDAHTLVYRKPVAGGGAANDGNVLFAQSLGGTVSNSGGTVTFSGSIFIYTYPELFGQSTLVISGTGTAFDGACTNSVASSSGQLTCTQAASTGLGPVSGMTVGIGTQYGNTGGYLRSGAEVLDVQDYTTNPPSVSPGNVTTFALEPNNAAWAANDAVENVHHYALFANIMSSSLAAYNPMKASAPATNINLVGAVASGGLASSSTDYSAYRVSNFNPWSMYKYHGGSLTPPGGIRLAGGTGQALFNYALAMEYAPDPVNSSAIYIGCPASGCTDAAFYYNFFTLGSNSATGNSGLAQAQFYPNTRTLKFLLGALDLTSAPLIKPTIQSPLNGSSAILYFNSIDSGAVSHPYSIAAPITGTGGTLNLPVLSGNGTLALNTPFGASGSNHAAGLVPDPGSSSGVTHFLREDATWAIIPTMGASGSSHASGLVPDPGSSAGSTKYLREDGTFAVPPGSGGLLTNVPPDLQFLGDGSEGAFNCTTSGCTITLGEHWYSSFTISSSGIVTGIGSPGQAPLIIRSTGTCTIAGTLSLDAKNTNGAGNWGGGGGAGGGGTGAGTAGGNSFGGMQGGTAGTAGGGTGGAGTATLTSATPVQRMLLSGQAPFMSFNTASGLPQQGGGTGGTGGSSGPVGGAGGGMIILDCQTINFTGTITASGANGSASTGNNIGASGGGGGGVIILRSPNLTNTGTTAVTGGTGGSCGAFTGCGTGGNGASGWTTVISN